MAYSYEIDKKRRLVISTAWDVVTGEEVIEHQNRLIADPDFEPGFYQLVDLSGVTEMRMSANKVAELAVIEVFSSGSRRAAFAPTPLAYGMVRMFMAFRELVGGREHMEVFEDRVEALQWLFPLSDTRGGLDRAA